MLAGFHVISAVLTAGLAYYSFHIPYKSLKTERIEWGYPGRRQQIGLSESPAKFWFWIGMCSLCALAFAVMAIGEMLLALSMT